VLGLDYKEVRNNTQDGFALFELMLVTAFIGVQTNNFFLCFQAEAEEC